MVGEASDSQFPAGCVDSTLTLVNTHNRIAQKLLLVSLAFDALQQAAHIRNHRQTANFPILGPGSWVTHDGDFAFLEIAVTSANTRRLPFSAAAVSKKLNKVSAFFAPGAVGLADGVYHFNEVLLAGKLQEFLSNLLPLDVDGRIVVPRARLHGNIQDQLERADCVVKG